MSSSKAGDRKFLYYKLVLVNKASIPVDELPDTPPIIGDYPPLAIDGFYCCECKEVAMPVKNECEEVALPDDNLQTKGFVLVAHYFNKRSNKFWKNFWKQPASNYVNQQNFYEDMLEYEDMPEYKDMLKLWPSLYNKYSSTKKCWNFHCIKNKVGLECKNDSYLALATGYGKKWINHFLDELRNQKEYDFGSNEMYSCKNFELWVNRIFKHKVDCRFYRLPYDERYFGLKEIGILGKLYLDDLTWELVDLVVPEANVKIDDESKFDLQDFHQSTWAQLRNQKMEDEDI